MNTRHISSVLLLAALCCTGNLQAQVRDSASSGSGGSPLRPVAISGEIGAYGELYSMSGRDARRPSQIGRLFFRPTVTLFNAVSLGFDVMVSTEGSMARQDINQFGLNPTWNWGEAHLGDFTDMYAQYTLNGVRIRGGGFFINPGILRLGAVGGMTRRAVTGTADNGSYDRYLYGGRIGIGARDGSAFELVFLRVRDKVSSLAPPVQTTGFDSASGLYTTPAFEATPQENMLVGVMSHLTAFDSHVTWDVEATGSIHSRDMRVEQGKQLNLPAWVNDLYRVNVTSSAGAALRTEVGVHTQSFSITSGYRYITPGYTSLATASLINDWQEFTLSPSFRFGRWTVSLNTMRQNDNLFGQKLNTIIRWNHGGTVSFQPTDHWSGSVMGNVLTMANDAANDTFKVSYTSLMLGTNQYLMFAEGSTIQAITMNYMYQQSGNASPLHPGGTFTSHSGNFGVTLPLSQELSLLPGAGAVVSWSSGQSAQVTQTYTLALQHRTMESVLVSMLTGVMSLMEGTSTFRSMFTSTYRLTQSASIGLTLSMMNYRTNTPYGGKFDEFSASVYLTHRF